MSAFFKVGTRQKGQRDRFDTVMIRALWPTRRNKAGEVDGKSFMFVVVIFFPTIVSVYRVFENVKLLWQFYATELSILN